MALLSEAETLNTFPEPPPGQLVVPPDDPILVPPTLPSDDLQTPPSPIDSGNPSVQDLYPSGGQIGDVVSADPGEVIDPVGAAVTENDPSVTEFDTTAAEDSADRVSGLLDAGGGGIDAEQTALTDEQRVDEELARILGEDSPLLAQARAEAARYANTRGLQNTSMAAGMATAEMVKAALPMAQQNASQAAARELSNTASRQQASMFTAEQQNRLTQLEAELGQQLNIFNAEQLNAAEEIMAQMRTALEQQDTAAYNNAATQLANLQRDAQAQQAELDYRASQAEADAINNRNAQIVDSVTRLNQQFLQNMGNADIANIQGTYQQLISTNQAAGSIFQSMMSSMAALMDNPDMTPQQVSTGLASMQQMLEASLRMLSNINDMDFGDSVAATMPSVPTTSGPGSLPGGIPGGEIFR